MKDDDKSFEEFIRETINNGKSLVVFDNSFNKNSSIPSEENIYFIQLDFFLNDILRLEKDLKIAFANFINKKYLSNIVEIINEINENGQVYGIAYISKLKDCLKKIKNIFQISQITNSNFAIAYKKFFVEEHVSSKNMKSFNIYGSDEKGKLFNSISSILLTSHKVYLNTVLVTPSIEDLRSDFVLYEHFAHESIAKYEYSNLYNYVLKTYANIYNVNSKKIKEYISMIYTKINNYKLILFNSAIYNDTSLMILLNFIDVYPLEKDSDLESIKEEIVQMILKKDLQFVKKIYHSISDSLTKLCKINNIEIFDHNMDSISDGKKLLELTEKDILNGHLALFINYLCFDKLRGKNIRAELSHPEN